MNTIKVNNYRFFKANAGYIVGESAICAMRLAKAEYQAKLLGFTFEWEYDDDPDYSWLNQPGFEKEKDKEHEVTVCLAKNQYGNVVASLSGIFDADNNYRRVIEAELALEVLSILQTNKVDIS